MIVVTTRFSVRPEEQSDFEQRLRDGVQLLQSPPGLIRNEVHRPCAVRFEQGRGQFVTQQRSSAQYEVKTWWRSFDDFVAWTKSPSFREAHADRPPKEMFSGKNVLDIHEVFLSSDEGS